jgi:hypothetical protein
MSIAGEHDKPILTANKLRKFKLDTIVSSSLGHQLTIAAPSSGGYS